MVAGTCRTEPEPLEQVLVAKIDDARSVVVNLSLIALRDRSNLSSVWYDVIMQGLTMGFVFKF